MSYMAENKIVVLDDDPTGIQAIHDLVVYTSFDSDTLIKAFGSSYRIIFLSTNSRSLTKDETIRLHKEIMENLFIAKEKTGKDFEVISRGDSTLRGHYPTETEIIAEVYKKHGTEIDGEIICPFLNGIRKTENDIHYVLNNNEWIKCGDSEFAKDETFAYKSSDLKDYVEEKYGCKKSFVSIGLNEPEDTIISKLEKVKDDTKIIVNALSDEDVEHFAKALKKVKDKKFLCRTAASFVKAYGGVSFKPLLEYEDIADKNGNGVLVFAGSHVKKTNDQINTLIKNIPFEVLTYKDNKEELIKETNRMLGERKNVLVETPRELIRVSDDPYERLMASRNLSKDFTSLLNGLKTKPEVIISKGGITSYDVLGNGLGASEYYVLGQIISAVPVCKLLNGPFKGSNVIVFPGNVGNSDSLVQILKHN